MRLFINIIVALLLFTACEDLPSSGEEAYPLQMELELASDQFDSLNDLEGSLKLTNISKDAVKFSFPSSCKTAFTIHKDGELIFDSRDNIMCAAVITHLEWESEETKTSTISLENSEINNAADPGSYTIRAFLRNDYEPKVEAHFTVK